MKSEPKKIVLEENGKYKRIAMLSYDGEDCIIQELQEIERIKGKISTRTISENQVYLSDCTKIHEAWGKKKGQSNEQK